MSMKDGQDIPTIPDLLEHKGVWTTMDYTHWLNCGCKDVRSPMGSI